MILFDCDFDITHMIPALEAKGDPEIIVGRYISSYMHSWKVTGPKEFGAIAVANLRQVDRYGDAGYFKVWLIFEDDGKPRTAGTGAANALVTRKWIDMLNMPVGGLICYTSDEDGPVNQVCAATAAYFDGLKDAKGSYIPKRGLYASGTVAETAFERKIIDVRWPTMSLGFSGTREALRQGNYEMAQGLDVHFAGQNVDPDTIRPGLDPNTLGFWAPELLTA